MHGIPKILSTRADFDLLLGMAREGEADPAAVAAHFTGLLGSAHHYAFDKVLEADAEPDGPMPAYCVTEPTPTYPVRAQLKLVLAPEARIFTLGYTIAEVTDLIEELGALK